MRQLQCIAFLLNPFFDQWGTIRPSIESTFQLWFLIGFVTKSKKSTFWYDVDGDDDDYGDSGDAGDNDDDALTIHREESDGWERDQGQARRRCRWCSAPVAECSIESCGASGGSSTPVEKRVGWLVGQVWARKPSYFNPPPLNLYKLC